MIPPTSIDGTDITGATIDGTDVTEITIDGDTVFSAGSNLPVAYSNLVAWYPFDSAEYGGSNADDVTAIVGGSGDDTAYDGTVNGATYLSNGGITDINKGANSGAFDFIFNVVDEIVLPNQLRANYMGDVTTTHMCWINWDGNTSQQFIFGDGERNKTIFYDNGLGGRVYDGNSATNIVTSINSNEWYHVAMTYDDNTSDFEVFVDGSSIGSDNATVFLSNPGGEVPKIGNDSTGTFVSPFGGEVDDARVYDRVLTNSEISQIYQNTEP